MVVASKLILGSLAEQNKKSDLARKGVLAKLGAHNS